MPFINQLNKRNKGHNNYMARKEQIAREMFHSRITEEDNREVTGEQNEMSGALFMP